MKTRLATSDIVIDLQPSITLRPTLRAALRLGRLHDGYPNLLRLVTAGNINAISDVIREGAGDCTVTRYLDALDDLPLHIGIERLKYPCIHFIFALLGPEDSPDGAPGKKISFEDYFVELYRIATGWLGWTPEDAFNASPAEIIEAQKGRAAMLAAIFGGKKDDKEPIDLTTMNADDRRAHLQSLASIGDLTVNRMR